MKNMWRGMWLAAVVFGGVAFVKIALMILSGGDKKYIDV